MRLAKQFAAALDADDYPALKDLLADECQYVTSKGTLIGPQAILTSYRDASIWTKSHIQHVEYRSAVRVGQDGNAVVTFIDRFEQDGLTHEYACEQQLIVDSRGRVCRIIHRELPGRREAVDAFLQSIGVKRHA